MTNRHTDTFTTQVVVTSSPASLDVEPITARASISGTDIDLQGKYMYIDNFIIIF